MGPAEGGVAGAPTADPATAMLRGGLLPAAVVGALTIAVGAFAGGAEAAGAGLGAVVVMVSLGAGPLIMKWTSHASPPAVMAAALGGWGALVLVLGAVWVVLEGATWLSFGYLGAALVACCSAWLVGEVRAVARLRILTFGSPSGAPEEGPARTDGGPGGAG